MSLCGCCGFRVIADAVAKMGISRAHESAPRSISLVHGTDPCTTEDHPLSVDLSLNNLATLSAQLNTLRSSHSSRSSIHFTCCFNLAARPFHTQSNILFSLIHYSLPRISRAAQYLVATQNGRSKKIGKGRGPAEQVARQTWYPDVDATGLTSPEVHTMRQQLKLAASKRK